MRIKNLDMAGICRLVFLPSVFLFKIRNSKNKEKEAPLLGVFSAGLVAGHHQQQY
jgi:hypothetical protein